MPEIKHFYVIRCDLGVALGLGPSVDPSLLSYVSAIHVGSNARGVDCSASQDIAIKFGSWDEAAAAAVFIIHHVNEFYEDALEIICIDS